jgi:hypothetical protein
MINFEATLKALSDSGVNFVVIGGYAATLHGLAYLTRDLDICYASATHVFPALPESTQESHVSAQREYLHAQTGSSSLCSSLALGMHM